MKYIRIFISCVILLVTTACGREPTEDDFKSSNLEIRQILFSSSIELLEVSSTASLNISLRNAIVTTGGDFLGGGYNIPLTLTESDKLSVFSANSPVPIIVWQNGDSRFVLNDIPVPNNLRIYFERNGQRISESGTHISLPASFKTLSPVEGDIYFTGNPVNFAWNFTAPTNEEVRSFQIEKVRRETDCNGPLGSRRSHFFGGDIDADSYRHSPVEIIPDDVLNGGYPPCSVTFTLDEISNCCSNFADRDYINSLIIADQSFSTFPPNNRISYKIIPKPITVQFVSQFPL